MRAALRALFRMTEFGRAGREFLEIPRISCPARQDVRRRTSGFAARLINTRHFLDKICRTTGIGFVGRILAKTHRAHIFMVLDDTAKRKGIVRGKLRRDKQSRRESFTWFTEMQYTYPAKSKSESSCLLLSAFTGFGSSINACLYVRQTFLAFFERQIGNDPPVQQRPRLLHQASKGCRRRGRD